ncbi:MAG: SAVED domain-containing protein [Acidimicrobiales bacterium]
MNSGESIPARRRPSIPKGDAFDVWVAAAGRCTFCNRLVGENDLLGEAVNIGQLAHIVGWGDSSPRGINDLDIEQRQLADNLILACASCHKPVDDKGVLGRYSVEELHRRKVDHETRIRELTSIGADRSATIVRLAGKVRELPPEMSRETVLDATTRAGLYPNLLPGRHWQDLDSDLRPLGDPSSPEHYAVMQSSISELAAQIHDGVRTDSIKRLAVFAFARIPLLIAVGVYLDDKVPTYVFDRQHIDAENAWTWPSDLPTIELQLTLTRKGLERDKVALVVSLSGTIADDELPSNIDEAYSIYRIAPKSGDTPRSGILKSTHDLKQFEEMARSFLGAIEHDHGKIPTIHLFPATSVGASVTLGRVLMPNISPTWSVYDRNKDRDFQFALEVGA